MNLFSTITNEYVTSTEQKEVVCFNDNAVTALEIYEEVLVKGFLLAKGEGGY